MQLIFLLISLPSLLVFIEFLGVMFTGRRVINKIVFLLTETASLIILPLMYANFGKKNDCCGGDLSTAVFSPDHQFTIAVYFFLCLLAYFYSSYRSKIAPPILEILVNTLLFAGIVLNIFIGIHVENAWLLICGNIPVILLGIIALSRNQRAFLEYATTLEFNPKNRLERLSLSILRLKPILKFPVIFILCLPLLLIITSVLLLVGQKPDSLIRAFTDTYRHGLSQWDYQCDNVECGGHFLCSVAAKGHTRIVKPQRLGIRNGHLVTCNRQLLISNAFEELMQEKLPALHRAARRQYNKVGNFIHRHYHVFNNKLLADLIYLLMKPLELLFLLVLYTFDRKPENRIAKQYLSAIDRKKIEKDLT